ncbi:MAG: hypothetical protein NC405_03385 [Odoribacter sp.]|nr:hypothetical protein [Odoribacter sp.]
MSWYNTVEFYVIAGAAAAAVVALTALPSRRTAAVLHTVAGDLARSDNPVTEPSIDVEVDSSRRVRITRHGLRGIGDDGAVSLAVNVIGFDIEIEERLAPGRYPVQERDTAVFTLDFLGAERYHIRYNSEDAGVFAAFTLPVKEGIKIKRELK